MSRATLLSTANAAIEGYNKWTKESIMSYRAPHCIHQVLPASTNRQPLNNEEYLAFFTPMLALFKDFHVVVKNTVVDEETRQVTMHATSSAMTSLGEYGNEYVLMLRMTEDGTKVEKFDEFVDSKYSSEFITALRNTAASKHEGPTKEG